MTDLKITFESAKNDVLMAWNNPLRSDDRITREWIYSVDPETMEYVATLYKSIMPGEYSLYTTFVRVMKSKDFETFLDV